MSLGHTQFPRKTGVLDTGPARCSSTTIVTGDENMLGFSFGDSGSYNTNSDLGYELDRDAPTGVCGLQIVNELFQILDTVNIVMRRRLYKTDCAEQIGIEAFHNARDLKTILGLPK